MIPELGHYALILATLVALLQGILPLAGTIRQEPRWQALARPVAGLQFVLVALAFASLASAFLSNDFSVLYVAEHSNSLLPPMYRFAAVWGGHEGSLLLWVLLLATWTLAVAIFSGVLDRHPRMKFVMAESGIGWIPYVLERLDLMATA